MNSHYTPIKHNDIDNQLFTFNWPAVITLIVNTITQSGAVDYTQRVRSRAFVTLVIEHCLTAFFDVSFLSQPSQNQCQMSNSVRGYLNSSIRFQIHLHVHASCSHDGLSNPYAWIRWMASQHLKLLITRSILSGPLDCGIKRVACMFNLMTLTIIYIIQSTITELKEK